jgi:hypothetical protein
MGRLPNKRIKLARRGADGLRGFRDSDVVAGSTRSSIAQSPAMPVSIRPRAVDFFKRFHSLEAIGNRALADVIVVVEANKHIEQTRGHPCELPLICTTLDGSLTTRTDTHE